MKRFLSLLLILAALLSLAACASGQPEILDDPGLEIFHIDEKEEQVVADDDWDDWDAEQPQSEQTVPESQSEQTAPEVQAEQTAPAAPALDEDGVYTSRDEVALYIHTYGHLPANYITKKQAQSLGWEGGKLESYAPGKSIGGDYFGNYEGQLPKKKGRKYYECDIDAQGKKSRGAKRIVYSNDGLIYYTGDHYETFELLYGEP